MDMPKLAALLENGAITKKDHDTIVAVLGIQQLASHGNSLAALFMAIAGVAVTVMLALGLAFRTMAIGCDAFVIAIFLFSISAAIAKRDPLLRLNLKPLRNHCFRLVGAWFLSICGLAALFTYAVLIMLVGLILTRN